MIQRGDARYAGQVRACLDRGWEYPSKYSRGVIIAQMYRADSAKRYWDGEVLVSDKFRPHLQQAADAAYAWWQEEGRKKGKG